MLETFGIWMEENLNYNMDPFIIYEYLLCLEFKLKMESILYIFRK